VILIIQFASKHFEFFIAEAQGCLHFAELSPHFFLDKLYQLARLIGRLRRLFLLRLICGIYFNLKCYFLINQLELKPSNFIEILTLFLVNANDFRYLTLQLPEETQDLHAWTV
jgi:hypothetical protein